MKLSVLLNAQNKISNNVSMLNKYKYNTIIN